MLPRMASRLRRLASNLPDIPRWVETRDKLLSGRCELLGLEDDGSMDFVVKGDDSLICVVGTPGIAAIETAVHKSSPQAEVLAIPENSEHVASALRGWQQKKAFIHLLAKPVEGEVPKDVTVRFVRKPEISFLKDEFPTLASELSYVLSISRAAALFEKDKPISFCSVASQTESLWDVSIDTLPSYRRRGYAQACVQFLINEMLKNGKQPVWGAEEWNVPSLNLAAKMGFEVVDHLFVFSQE